MWKSTKAVNVDLQLTKEEEHLPRKQNILQQKKATGAQVIQIFWIEIVEIALWVVTKHIE